MSQTNDTCPCACDTEDTISLPIHSCITLPAALGKPTAEEIQEMIDAAVADIPGGSGSGLTAEEIQEMINTAVAGIPGGSGEGLTAAEVQEMIDAAVAGVPGGSGSGMGSAFPGKLLFSQTAAGTGSWTAPDENNGAAYIIQFELKGAGSGGAAGYRNGTQYFFTGPAGSEGETCIGKATVIPGQSYAWIVGAGGAGGKSSNAQMAAGGSTTFNSIIAEGGNPPMGMGYCGAIGGGRSLVSDALIRIKGENSNGANYAYGAGISGCTGAGRYGGRGAATYGSATPIIAPTPPEAGLFGCGGGSGAWNNTATPYDGAAGGDGYIRIWMI